MPLSPIVTPAIAVSRSRAIVLVCMVFTFFFAAYVFTASSDLFSTGDTTIRMEMADNMLNRHAFDIEGWKLQYPRHVKVEFLDSRVDKGKDGKTYSTYLPGQPLAIIPFFALGTAMAAHERWPLGPTQLWFSHLVGPLFGALEVLVFFLFAIRLGYGYRRSLLLSLILAFASSVWPDEQSVLEHTEVAFFLLLGVYLVFRYREQGRGWPYVVLAGVSVGGAAITRYQDAIVASLAIGVYLLWPGGAHRRVVSHLSSAVLYGLSLAPFVAFDLWFDWYRFGSPLATGHHERILGYTVWKGALGLTVSPGKGLLWYCPVILLLFIAGPRFARRFPALMGMILLLAATFFLFYGYVTFWHGDPAWGPRYVYPVVPFLLLPMGEIFLFRSRWRLVAWLVTALIVLGSFIIQLSAVSVSEWRGWYRVISYEESQGHQWEWIPSRYRYFWNIHESPLLFQVHGLYQLAYDQALNSQKYVLVPPPEDAVLDRMTTSYSINDWNFWWSSSEFNWWMGDQKVVLGVVMLVAIMLASGTYLVSEATEVFQKQPTRRPRDEPLPEAA